MPKSRREPASPIVALHSVSCRTARDWLRHGIPLTCLLCSATTWAQTAPETDEEQARDIGEILVTGTTIRGEQPTGSVLITVDRDAIDRSSAANFANLIADMPVFNGFNTAPEQAVGLAGSNAGTPPSMRGLPAGATLVMLNGHRLVGVSPLSTIADPTALPLAAIDRVEIVPDGASAIYGSDAIAGVINIITLSNYEGASFTFRRGDADQYDGVDYQGVGGVTWEGGSALLAAGYSENSELFNLERDFFQPNLTQFGGTDFRQTYCTPPNVIVDGTNYTPPDYAAGAPSPCENDGNNAILSDNHRRSILATIRQEVGERFSMFADMSYTDTDNIHRQPDMTTDLSITDVNPFFVAPPGTGATSAGLQFNLGSILPPNNDEFSTDSGGVTLGGDWNVDDNWHVLLTATYGDSSSSARDQGFNQAALVAAANGTTTDTALDPFGDGTNPSVAAGIGDFATRYEADQQLLDFTLKLDGALFEIPTGTVKVALGGGYREEDYDAVSYVGPSGGSGSLQAVAAKRDVLSGYVELLVPLASRLNLSAAVRYDDYSDFGSTTNPKFGLTWNLAEQLTFRASYGTSFHAPSLADTQAVDTRAILFPGFPLSVGPDGQPMFGPVNTIVLAGGNPELQPEEGKSYSAGFDWVPTDLPLRASINYFDIDYTNQITSLFFFFPFPFFSDPNIIAQGVVSNPTQQQVDEIVNNMPLENFIEPVPPIGQILDLRRLNLSSRRVKGLDLGFAHQWRTGAGILESKLTAVHTLSYDLMSVPGAPNADLLENGFGEIPWRGRVEFNWSDGGFSAGASLNYTGEYDFSYLAPGGGNAIQKVDSYAVVDLRARYTLPFQGIGEGISLLLSVNNVLDEDPPMVLGRVEGFDPSQANAIGRMYWFGLRKDF